MKKQIPITSATTVQDIYDAIVNVAFGDSNLNDQKEFFESFKYGEGIREFCRGIYNTFKKYKVAPRSKAGEEVILMPSYVIREQTYNVKSLCIMYSKILQYHNISHQLRLVRLGINSAYVYVVAFDEYGEPIHLHTDFSAPFDLEIEEFPKSRYEVTTVYVARGVLASRLKIP